MRLCRNAKQDEQNGFPFAAALEWRESRPADRAGAEVLGQRVGLVRRQLAVCEEQ